MRKDQVIALLRKRFFIPAVCAVAGILWLTLCWKHWDSYWNGTIRRVQTVDFNMLHHTLPITLSYLVLTGQDESIQQVLDSNYGIFGLVITDPQGKNIIYKTEKFYHQKSWQNLLNVDYLKQLQNEPEAEHFDVLTDPPPSGAQYAHDTPRKAGDRAIDSKPPGRVIGRVYYVRQPPPTFAQDMGSFFLSNPLELSGSKRGYALHSVNVLAFCAILILLGVWRRQYLESKEKQLISLENELITKRRALEMLTADLAAQRKRKDWLEHEAEKAYNRALKLKVSLEKLKDAFFFTDMQPRPESVMLNRPGHNVSVRPPSNPPSAVIEEIESLLPDLTNNARILRSQAEVLQTYCSQLESRQNEMQQIIEHVRVPSRSPVHAPAGPHLRPHLTADQPTP